MASEEKYLFSQHLPTWSAILEVLQHEVSDFDGLQSMLTDLHNIQNPSNNVSCIEVGLVLFFFFVSLRHLSFQKKKKKHFEVVFFFHQLLQGNKKKMF